MVSTPKETYEAPRVGRDLFRLCSLRYLGSGDAIRHTNWFSTERGMRDHAEWIEKNGGKVLAMFRYELKEQLK